MLSGAAVSAGTLGLPFLLAGALKIAYDGLVYAAFRSVRPPEERHRPARPDSSGSQGSR